MASAVTLTITRTELSLATLNLNDPGVYGIRSFSRGRVRRRRQRVSSPYVEGSTLVGSVRDLVEMDLAIDVEATTQATIETRLTALIAAFSQSTYTLTYGLDANTYAWTCEPADIEPGLATPDVIFGFVLPVGLIIPSSPVPTDGPI